MYEFRVDQKQNQRYTNITGRKNTARVIQTLQNTLPHSTLTQPVIFSRCNFSSEQCFYYSSNLKKLLSLSSNNSGRKMFSPPLTNQKQIVSNKSQAYHGNLDSYCFSHSQSRLHFLKSTNLVLNFLYQSKGFQSRNSYFLLAIYLKNIKNWKTFFNITLVTNPKPYTQKNNYYMAYRFSALGRWEFMRISSI